MGLLPVYGGCVRLAVASFDPGSMGYLSKRYGRRQRTGSSLSHRPRSCLRQTLTTTRMSIRPDALSPLACATAVRTSGARRVARSGSPSRGEMLRARITEDALPARRRPGRDCGGRAWRRVAKLRLDRVLAEVEMPAELPVGHAGGQERSSSLSRCVKREITPGPAQFGRLPVWLWI
jgi:hypothetical protein